MITLKWAPQGKKEFTKLNIESCTWSGTENQAARMLEFTVPWNPYDKGFSNPSIGLGDQVKLYSDKTLLFVGVITSRERTAAIGTSRFSAYDYMHYLLRSTVTKKFDNTTPKKATVSLCKQVGVKTGTLEDPNINIEKSIFKEKSIYDIIIAMYRKAYLKNKIKYMPVMKGNKLTIIQKGQSSNVTLRQDVDITNATYHDTTDEMVNYVTIYNDKNQKTGIQKNKKNIKKYGTYMQAYTKQKGVSSTAAAKAMLVGVTKEASVEALGNVNCISGRSLKISDKATGITGKFYISSDSHTFQNGIHTMKLELNKKNVMEEGADEEKEEKKDDD